MAWERLRGAQLRVGIRHFPVKSAHKRAMPAACAVEAAGRQDRFWEMVDRLLIDQARIEDPDLWRHAQELQLDVDRFEADRRSAETAAKVDADFRAAIRAGVATTPSFLVAGELFAGVPSASDVELWASTRSL